MIIKHNPEIKKVVPNKEQPVQVEEVREPVSTERVDRDMKIIYSEQEDKFILVADEE